MTCPPGYYQPAGSENVMDSCSMCEPGKPCSGELVWSSCEASLVVLWQARFKPKKDRSRARRAPSSALGSLIRRPHQCAHNARPIPNLPNVWMKWIKCTAATELACKPNNFVASSGRFHSRLMRRPRRCKDGYFNKNRRAVCQHAALCLLATARKAPFVGRLCRAGRAMFSVPHRCGVPWRDFPTDTVRLLVCQVLRMRSDLGFAVKVCAAGLLER
jgi:hypothetical protein